MATMAVRGLGGLALVLGLVLWTGAGPGLQGLHMLVGLALVVALWAAAIAGLRAGAGRGIVVVALVWGLFVAVFGMVQRTILPADGHLVVQVAHLVAGLVAIGLGEMLGAASRRAGGRPA